VAYAADAENAAQTANSIAASAGIRNRSTDLLLGSTGREHGPYRLLP
jgi:hypothetical protein